MSNFAVAGVIDADYRGNVGVILFNHAKVDFTGENSARLRCVPDATSPMLLALPRSSNIGCLVMSPASA